MKTSPILIVFIFFMIIGCSEKQNPKSENFVLEKIRKQDSIYKIDAIIHPTSEVKYSTEQLDNTNGLSNSSVNTIFQDSENLIWIGTWDGLNRYDGHNFKIFRPELNNENSLTNQVILKVDEDYTGQIWVLTMHGLNRYDKKTNSFKNYYFSRKDKPPFSESEFNMALDGSKNVFCAVKDWGIGYFNGNDFQAFEIENLPSNAVIKMAFMPNGKLLLLLDNNELYSLKLETTQKNEKVVSSIDLILKNVADFEMVSLNNIYIIKDSGSAVLYSFVDKTELPIGENVNPQIISKTKEGILLNSDFGYVVMDSLGKQAHNSWVENLQHQKITTLLQGTENVIWTGTDGDGLFKMYPLKKTFNLVSKTQIPEFEGGIVRAFLKIEENSFWVGTKGSGLFKYPSEFYLNPNQPLKYQNFNEKNS